MIEDKLRLFISYSHLDEAHIKDFIIFLAPLKDNGLIQEWYDGKINAGDDFDKDIENNLENADIICLFISANFLNSNACKKEKRKAFELRNKKNTHVVPIILSNCGWLDDIDLSPKLALPKDGKPISGYSDKSAAWQEIYNTIKNILKSEELVRNLKVTENFNSFLQDTDLLTKAHSQKEKVLLDDIFIYPNLMRIDEVQDFDKKISSEMLISDFMELSRVMIAGEDQAGKTCLCKKIFVALKEKYLIPVYIAAKSFDSKGIVEKKIIKALNEQYGLHIEEIDTYLKKKIVPIIDDFHLLKNKEKYVDKLTEFNYLIVTVDNIFTLNFTDENTLQKFRLFKILELNPYLRYELAKKWVNLHDKLNQTGLSPNNIYKSIDQKTEFIDQTLGKVLSSGIMPAYPFVILSVISYYEIFEKPLDQEITSQGYCYQALIFLYLRKEGVKNDEIDTYINFLTEVSFHLFNNEKLSIPENEFSEFLNHYLAKFNMPIEPKVLLKKLSQSKIFGLDNLNNYHFTYPYIYYYFIAKYLAENYDKCKDKIASLVQNLHKNENAYITIFIAHHSKNNGILDEIILNSLILFDKNKPATLIKEELSFFDTQVEDLIKEILPAYTNNPEQVRKKNLELQEISEENNTKEEQDLNSKTENPLAKELRRSIKTVEVMGRILKNRAGSLEKDRLVFIFEEAMNVHLRILSSFFALINNEKTQDYIISFLTKRLDAITEKLVKEKKRKPNQETIEKLSRVIFWNTNFLIVYSFIVKLIQSIGSDKLLNIVSEVCDRVNTPAAFLVKHGILMWYNKNLQIDVIAEEIEKTNFSEISKKIMKRLIVRHASMHVLDYKDRQRIESKLNIPSARLLIEKMKSDKNN